MAKAGISQGGCYRFLYLIKPPSFGRGRGDPTGHYSPIRQSSQPSRTWENGTHQHHHGTPQLPHAPSPPGPAPQPLDHRPTAARARGRGALGLRPSGRAGSPASRPPLRRFTPHRPALRAARGLGARGFAPAFGPRRPGPGPAPPSLPRGDLRFTLWPRRGRCTGPRLIPRPYPTAARPDLGTRHGLMVRTHDPPRIQQTL